MPKTEQTDAKRREELRKWAEDGTANSIVILELLAMLDTAQAEVEELRKTVDWWEGDEQHASDQLADISQELLTAQAEAERLQEQLQQNDTEWANIRDGWIEMHDVEKDEAERLKLFYNVLAGHYSDHDFYPSDWTFEQFAEALRAERQKKKESELEAERLRAELRARLVERVLKVEGEVPYEYHKVFSHYGCINCAATVDTTGKGNHKPACVTMPKGGE